jgi:hypothetical protein
VTGATSGIIVIDIDPQHGGSIAALAKFGTLPATIASLTPSGGCHLFFACRACIPNSVSRLAPGVDVRGEGGFVVLPPSAIQRDDGSWRRYRWQDGYAPGEIQIADLPEAIALAALPPTPPAPSELQIPHRRSARIDGLIRVILSAGRGQRNASTFWTAVRLGELVRQGSIDQTLAIAITVEAAVRVGLDAREASATALSGIRRGMGR